MGEYLATRGETPQLVLCSSSRRTRETLERVVNCLAERPEVSIEPDLYLASVERLLGRVQELPEHLDRAMLVGHNPGIADLAQLLATKGAAELRKSLAEKFPTAALAILRLEGPSWPDAEAGARLEAFVPPRELAGD